MPWLNNGPHKCVLPTYQEIRAVGFGVSAEWYCDECMQVWYIKDFTTLNGYFPVYVWGEHPSGKYVPPELQFTEPQYDYAEKNGKPEPEKKKATSFKPTKHKKWR